MSINQSVYQAFVINGVNGNVNVIGRAVNQFNKLRFAFFLFQNKSFRMQSERRKKKKKNEKKPMKYQRVLELSFSVVLRFKLCFWLCIY